MCQKCLLSNSDACAEIVEKWHEIEMTRDGQVQVWRQKEDPAGWEHVNALTDLVGADSIVVIAAAYDGCYDYHLIKDSSDGPFILPSDTTDDHGTTYQQGLFVFEGHFFLRNNIIDMAYKWANTAIVNDNTVRAICGELVMLKRRRKELSKLTYSARGNYVYALYFSFIGSFYTW